MKKIIYSFLLICGLVSLTGCEDITSEDTSRLTYYVAFDMKGDKLMQIPVGSSYTDPGVEASLKGANVTSSMKVTGDVVDPNTIGLYIVKYSGVNADGFTTSVSRTVIVCNPAVTTDISGDYISAAGTHRMRDGAKVSFSGYPINVKKIAPGFFFVSDFFGGYYFPRLEANDYTSAYKMTGYIKLNEDNTIGLLTSNIKGWGDSLDGMENGKYDPIAKSIYWEAAYAGSMSFNVTLTK